MYGRIYMYLISSNVELLCAIITRKVNYLTLNHLIKWIKSGVNSGVNYVN